MTLETNEFTIKGLINHLNTKYPNGKQKPGSKKKGKPFNSSDIAQYCMRGYIPYRYGGYSLRERFEQEVKIITVGETPVDKKSFGYGKAK